MRTGKLLMVTAVMAGLVSPSLMAKEASGTVGLGVGVAPDYEGSDDNEGTPVPIARYQWGSGRYVMLAGSRDTAKTARIKGNILAQEGPGGWELGPVYQHRFKRDDDVEDNRVKRMEERDSASELGGFLAYKTGPWRAQLLAVQDVTDEHDGIVAEVTGSYRNKISDTFTLTTAGSLAYGDDDFMDAYFGVTAKDAENSGLEEYEAEAGIKNVMVTVTANYNFSGNWSLMGTMGFSRLLGDAEDSPLVDGQGDENQVMGLAAVTYRF